LKSRISFFGISSISPCGVHRSAFGCTVVTEHCWRGGTWWHYLGSTWLVDAGLDAKTIFGRLRPHVDQNDYVLVIRVGHDREGWLPKEAWEWIKERESALA
jgi:hypothetical protein